MAEARLAENKAQHDCWVKFEKFAQCMTPAAQFRCYYREATYEDCPQHLHKFTTCLREKVPALNKDKKKLVARTESRTPNHIWSFVTQYEEEAQSRYA